MLANTSTADNLVGAGAPVFLNNEEPIEYEKRLENLRLRRMGMRRESKGREAAMQQGVCSLESEKEKILMTWEIFATQSVSLTASLRGNDDKNR